METCNLKLGQFIKTHKKREGQTRALIVENMQNCFFDKGAMGFMSQSTGEEKKFVDRINKLINFEESDPEYVKAGLSGKQTTKKRMNFLEKGEFETGSRKKFYFDIIIFTQITNPPDHMSFASTYYLDNPSLFKTFSSRDTGTAFITSKSKLKKPGKKTLYLLPDYALTDGADSYVTQGKTVKGIDFHINLDISSLDRPNQDLDPSVFINVPRYFNRGYIVTKGGSDSNYHSAFFNSNKKTTGLGDFLRCNQVNSIAVCGMGREDQVYHTMLDSLQFDFIKERVVLHDATRPINIDLSKFRKKRKIMADMQKDTIKGNKFLKRYTKRGIKVFNSDNLFLLVDDIDRMTNMNKLPRLLALEKSFEDSGSFPVSFNNLDSLMRSNNNTKPKKKSQKLKKKKGKRSRKLNPNNI